MDGLCCDGLCDLVGQVPFVFMGLVGISSEDGILFHDILITGW
jgi:hypothetical protein